MQRSLPCLLALVVACASAGCATQKTKTGRNTNLLAGMARIEAGSYQPASPASIDVDASDVMGRNNPSGRTVSFLWGLITFTDH